MNLKTLFASIAIGLCMCFGANTALAQSGGGGSTGNPGYEECYETCQETLTVALEAADLRYELQILVCQSQAQGYAEWFQQTYLTGCLAINEDRLYDDYVAAFDAYDECTDQCNQTYNQ